MMSPLEIEHELRALTYTKRLGRSSAGGGVFAKHAQWTRREKGQVEINGALKSRSFCDSHNNRGGGGETRGTTPGTASTPHGLHLLRQQETSEKRRWQTRHHRTMRVLLEKILS